MPLIHLIFSVRTIFPLPLWSRVGPLMTLSHEKGPLVLKGPARLLLAVVRGRESQLAGKGCPTPVIHTSGADDVLRLAPQTREALRASVTENRIHKDHPDRLTSRLRLLDLLRR